MKTLRDTQGNLHKMTNEDAAYWLRHSRFALVDEAQAVEIDADAQKVLDDTNPKTEDFTPLNDAGVAVKSAKTKKATTKK